MPTLKKMLFNFVNAFLEPLGLRLERLRDDFKTFIPFETTLAEAARAGLSVGDYIDLRHNVPGATQDTVDQMARLGVFDPAPKRICEIGPGSGRFMVKVIERCHPEHYEFYETAPKWREWLAQTYKAIAQPTDGMQLSATPDRSIDLVHTHKVLNGLKILNILGYFAEMERVCKEHGWVVFDILTEDCLDEETMQQWLSAGTDYITSMTNRQLAIDYFTRRGFTCAGSFFITSVPGKTNYFVFKR